MNYRGTLRRVYIVRVVECKFILLVFSGGDSLYLFFSFVYVICIFIFYRFTFSFSDSVLNVLWCFCSFVFEGITCYSLLYIIGAFCARPDCDYLCPELSGMIYAKWDRLCPRYLGVIFSTQVGPSVPKIFMGDSFTRVGPSVLEIFKGEFFHQVNLSVPEILKGDFFTLVGPSVPEIFRDDFSPKWDHL